MSSTLNSNNNMYVLSNKINNIVKYVKNMELKFAQLESKLEHYDKKFTILEEKISNLSNDNISAKSLKELPEKAENVEKKEKSNMDHKFIIHSDNKKKIERNIKLKQQKKPEIKVIKKDSQLDKTWLTKF